MMSEIRKNLYITLNNIMCKGNLKKMSETDTTTNKLSMANSAYSQIYRFDETWKNAYRHRSNGNHHAWNLDLDNIWLELSGDLKEKFGDGKEEYKKIMDKILEVNKNILSTYPLVTGTLASGFNVPSADSLKRVSKQYLFLMDKEQFLRELQNRLGKGTKWLDEDQDSM